MSEQTYRFSIEPQVRLDQATGQIAKLQQQLEKLSMPKTLGAELKKELGNLSSLMGKYKDQLKQGISSKADSKALDQTRKQIEQTYQGIANKIDELNEHEIILKADSSALKDLEKEITNLKERIQKEFSDVLSGDNTKLSGLSATTRSTQLKGMIGQAQTALEKGDLKAYEKALDNVRVKINDLAETSQKKLGKVLTGKEFTSGTDALNEIGKELEEMKGHANDAYNAVKPLQDELSGKEIAFGNKFAEALEKGEQSAQEFNGEVGKIKQNFDSLDGSVIKAQNNFEKLEKTTRTLENQVESYFGLNAIFRTVANLAREAMETVKALDKAMTETAVVTNFSVGDMWEMLPKYTKEANALGSTIEDVYRATTLYYQQGLNTTQSMGLAVETLKMARIAGMDAKDATDAMTAALRGFNLELNQASAQRINDVYSELAAITASDTQEISTAMEKVASLAHNAGMEVETTSAFLAQMIETTREAPENLGTALKTVVARFQEMKQDPTKLIDSEGVMLDANKVDKALKSIGVNLLNTNGEFRKLDDVFLEIASKWDTLSMGQQRYIATMAAGSRQQSRFIAMMSNYSRTIELVDAAYDASGASQRQFEKTLESMEAKLNKLKNAYDQFIMGLMNNEILKFAVDAGTEFFTVVNNIIDAISKIPPKPFEGITKSLVTLIATFGGLNAASKILHSGINAGVKWFKGDSNQGFFTSILTSGKTAEASSLAGKRDGEAYNQAYKASLSKLPNVIQQTLTGNLNWNQVATIAGNGSKDQQEALRQYLKEEISKEDLALKLNLELSESGEFISNIEGIDSVSGHLAATMSNTGAKMQAFGAILQGTPLAPFGALISKIGTTLITFNGLLTATAAQTKAAGFAAAEGAIGFSALRVHVINAGKALKAFFVESLLPFLANPAVLIAIAAIAAIGTVIGLVIRDVTKYDRQLRDSKEVATQAADAYDTLKQSLADLDNAINNLNENKNSFDGLVAGTDAFNEKLIENNKLVTDLLSKYSILSGYINTSETGIMTIDEEGIKAVRQQQQKLMAQASAISILSSADVNKQELQKQQRELFGNLTGNELAEKYAEGGVHSSEYNALQKEIDANMQAATNAAVNTLLATQQIQNEGTAKILQSNYDKYEAAAKKMAEEASKEEKRDLYAKTYGYTRDGKKYYDQNGDEVEGIDDDTVLESYVQIKIAEQLDIDASKVDKTLTSVSKNLSGIMGESFQDTNTFLADILSRNADTNHDFLKKITDNPQMLAELVQEMTDEQVAALLGEDVKVVSAQSEKFKKELIDEIISDTQEIARTQAATTGELSVRLARARGKTVQDFSPTTAEGRRYGSAQGNSNKLISKNSIAFKEIEKDISKLTYQQQASINKIVTSLEQNVGPAAMSAFLTNAIDAYNLNEGQYAAQLDAIFANADFDSALGRAEVYEQLENNHFGKNGEIIDEIAKIGKATKKASKDANVLGDAFLEVYSSADFTEVLEDLDKFKNEAGRIDANSIREMAKQSSSLARYLDLNKVSAEGFARLLDGFNATGINAIDEGVLDLLNSFNQLDNLVQETHDHISNFKGGIDTGEAEDFAIENYKKISEYWENGEYGNLDLHARIQEVVGIDNWIAALEANNGNFKDTINQFIPLLQQSEEGLYQNWANIANGISGYGKDLSENISKTNSNLGTNIAVGWANDGSVDLQTNGATTKEVTKWIQEVYGVSENYAKMMLEDFQNYSADLYQELQLNDWNAGLQDFADTHTFNDQIVIASDQLQLLAASTGKTTDQLIKDLAALDNRVVTTFDITEQGLAGFANIFNGQNLQEWLGYNADRDNDGQADQIYDITNAVSDMQSKGIDLANAQQALFDGIQDQTEVLYNGQKIQVDSLKSAEDLANKMEELNSLAEWDPVLDAFTNEATTFGTEAAQAFKASISAGTHTGDSGIGHGGGNVRSLDTELPEDTNTDYTLTLKKDPQWDATLNTTKQDIITLNEEYDKVQKERTLNLSSGAVTTATTRLTTLGTSLDTLSGKTATVYVDVVENKVGHGATGINNYVSSTGFYTGSTAKGTKGKLGPNGKGGMTLTGEEGYEIAWIPSENRSMIVGASGPQMIDLPGDTVIYNHEQSKKIIKQKGINLGSSARGYGGRGSSSGSGGSGSGSSSGSGSGSSSSSDKEKDPKRTNWYKEEITRFNLNQSINQITAEIEKTTKSIEKSLDKLGTKYSDIAKDVGEQANLIQQNIENQKKLRDSFQAQLNLLDNGGRSLWMDIIDSAGESSQKSISTGQFVYKDKDGSYKVDKNKVISYAASLGGDSETQKVNAETIFNTIQGELSNLSSGLLAATKAIRDAQDEYDALVQKVADAFYAWENELTKLYDLTNRMNEVDGRRARLTSETTMLLARVEAGFISIGKAGEYLARVQADGAALLTQQIELSRENIKTRREELNALLSSSDEKNEYDRIYAENQKLIDQGKYTGNKKVQGDAREKAAWQKYIASALMNSYVKQTQNQDGTFTFDFNEEQLEKDRKAGNISQETYEAIKEGYDKMIEKNEELNEAIAQAADDMAEVYETYNDHLQTMADLESKLTDAFEAAAKQEVSKLEALNTSLTNASKAILDQVKKNIQARRQAEDNAKTERDIAKKQQRLAALRANTGGGNQVEIAQLEKEIGDAQSSYGRTLEDQLMANMQSQADEASKQRQEQIDLAKQQIDYNRQTGLYAAEADKLLADVQGNQQAIQDILHATQTET